MSLDGPVLDNGSTEFSVTVCKTSGDPVDEPNVIIGWSWDGRAPSNFASLTLPPNVYSFLDKSRNVFQLPTLAQGDSYTVGGDGSTVAVPDRGNDRHVSFCLVAMVEDFSTSPSYDSNGNPVPDWTDPAAHACTRYTVR